MHRVAKPLFLKAFSLTSGRRLALVCLAAGLAAGLTACSALAPRPLPTPDEGFVVSGRLAIRAGDDGFSSNFIWEHAADDFAIELWGPLGQGRSRLDGHDGRVTLHAADGSVHHEPDTEAAVRRWLGIDLPVDALTFWIKGERSPDAPARRQAQTRLATWSSSNNSRGCWSSRWAGRLRWSPAAWSNRRDKGRRQGHAVAEGVVVSSAFALI
jgi:outer membrane biogenesis lipoprotein LolB